MMRNVLVASLLLGMVSTSQAHDAPSGWSYPDNCCSGQDCQEVNASAIKETPAGYRVTLRRHEHKMLTQDVQYLVPYNDTRRRDSPDGVYHVCIGSLTVPDGHKLICLFTPPKGF